MLTEFERAVKELKMVGGFIATGPTVKEPDHPDYERLYAKAAGRSPMTPGRARRPWRSPKRTAKKFFNPTPEDF